jgi:hypothetical protein
MLKLILGVLVIAVGIYLVIRFVDTRGTNGRGTLRPRPPAPDDDPDFLRDLDRRRRDDESSP